MALCGELPSSFEYFRSTQPTDPDMRDSATFWVMDQSGTLALPRVTLDAIGGRWSRPNLQLNLVLADGRFARVWTDAPGGMAHDARGRVSARSCGPLSFRCHDPFRSWSMIFDGAVALSQAGSPIPDVTSATETTPLAFSFDATMCVPPWLMGGLSDEAARAMHSKGAAALMGGIRYEQLAHLKGWLRLGDDEFVIDGTAMRVRRQGVRQMNTALGHCQLSALFPSGKAFGAIVMAPGPGAPVVFNEAFLYTPDGGRIPARVVQAPWMTAVDAAQNNATLILDSPSGKVVIEGHTLLSMFDREHFEMAGTAVLHQGTARYCWDGEETIGLIERCTVRSQLLEE